MADVGRGTTPFCTYETDIDLSTCEVIYVSFKQGSKVLIEKTKDELDVSPTRLAVHLTQEETLQLKHTQELRMQIRARYPDGTAVKSNIMVGNVGEILKDGEI